MYFLDKLIVIYIFFRVLKYLIDIYALKSKISVALNCLKTIKVDFDFNDIGKVIEKHVYPNLYKLLQVAISIPISSATCKIPFSSMKRIKN